MTVPEDEKNIFLSVATCKNTYVCILVLCAHKTYAYTYKTHT